jgi:hypothetical protein
MMAPPDGLEASPSDTGTALEWYAVANSGDAGTSRKSPAHAPLAIRAIRARTPVRSLYFSQGGPCTDT